MSEARAKRPVPLGSTEGDAALPPTVPPPAPESDPFGSLAHLGELPPRSAGKPENASASVVPESRPTPSQPPPATQRSHVRIKACVVEEMVVPSRKDYRRE